MAPFDIVIVGAGSAGAALAARLSEDPARSVLLLEAGPDHTAAGAPAGVHSPNFFNALAEPGRMWDGLTAIRAAGQPEAIYARGRGTGGSSSINALAGIRGTPDDYDRWAADLGCPGWGWPEMLDAFLRVEDDAEYGGDGLHGKGGPIPLTRTPLDPMAPLDVALRDAIVARGHPVADDYHAPGATGLSRIAATVRDGERVSTNDGYLEPARGRPNLAVRGDALVDRILFDGTGAVGVRIAGGDDVEAREVVVSGGAIHSPAILLRSGVGDGDGLRVGENLMDHAATPGFELALRPSGRLTTPDVLLLRSVLRYSSGLPEGGPNDMQIVWFGAIGTDAASLVGGRLFTAVMRVFSRGRVRLRSPDPADDPIVEFNMLSDERDLVRLRDGVRRTLEILRQPAVSSIVDEVLALTMPVAALESDDAIDAFLRANVNDYVHAAGTCRMGAPDDPAAVVDTDCRVIGYQGLRVCDASVMPELPKANTHLTTVAIAERLAEKMRAAGRR